MSRVLLSDDQKVLSTNLYREAGLDRYPNERTERYFVLFKGDLIRVDWKRP